MWHPKWHTGLDVRPSVSKGNALFMAFHHFISKERLLFSKQSHYHLSKGKFSIPAFVHFVFLKIRTHEEYLRKYFRIFMWAGGWSRGGVAA